MEITVSCSAVTQVEYKFNEWDIQRALVELIKREQPDRLLKGGTWTHEWWEEANGDLGFVFCVRQKVAEPRAEEV